MIVIGRILLVQLEGGIEEQDGVVERVCEEREQEEWKKYKFIIVNYRKGGLRKKLVVL